jgi:hypothetical protein
VNWLDENDWRVTGGADGGCSDRRHVAGNAPFGTSQAWVIQRRIRCAKGWYLGVQVSGGWLCGLTSEMVGASITKFEEKK